MELGEHNSTLRTRVRPPNERMLTLAALIVLFIGILLVSSILLYTHCYLRRVRQGQNRRPRPRQRIYLSASDVPKGHHGLDARVLSSLPVFTFSAAESNHPVECAVCLSEFEENESGRILPKCKHSFHIDCIDMWFYSHSTCPLCRATVEEHHPDQPADPVLVNLSVSDHVVSPEHKEQVVLVVPVRLMEDHIGADDDDGNSSEVIGSTSASPTTRRSFNKSPIITRMLSLKIRLLRSQRIMKETASCGGPDLESGEDEYCCSSSAGGSTVDSLTSFSLQTN